jgi:hypothetical protein
MEPLLDLPNFDLLCRHFSDDDLDTSERFWNSLWANYIRNKGSTSLPYWAEQFSNPVTFNQLLIVWKDYVNSVVIPERSWAEVSLNESTLLKQFTMEQLTEYRKQNKLKKYLPQAKASTAARLVRSQGVVSKTGLKRSGFCKAANSQYFYDTFALNNHKQMVVNNTTKSMRKLRETLDIDMDDAAYDMISTDIVEYLAVNPFIMTQGNSFCDSRGRAIKESLGKVTNPIGFKDFRALITIPRD